MVYWKKEEWQYTGKTNPKPPFDISETSSYGKRIVEQTEGWFLPELWGVIVEDTWGEWKKEAFFEWQGFWKAGDPTLHTNESKYLHNTKVQKHAQLQIEVEIKGVHLEPTFHYHPLSLHLYVGIIQS